MRRADYNVLVIGKTGVGKSSFVNYLFEKDIAKTGTGRPVTGRAFNEHRGAINNIPIALYDSWGLEADKHQEWLELFQKELDKRGVDKPAKDWFHSVFYLINAGGHRVEDADIKIIKKMHEENYCVNVVLSKCDMASEAQEKQMKTTLRKAVKGISVISVSSGGESRYGVTEPFGREDVIRQMELDFMDSLILRLPKHLQIIMDRGIEKLERKVREKIDDFGIFGDEKKCGEAIHLLVLRSANDISLAIDKDFAEAMNLYRDFGVAVSRKFSFPKINIKTSPELSWWERVLVIPALLRSRDSAKSALRRGFEEQLELLRRKLLSHIKKFENALKVKRNEMSSARV